MNVAEVFAHWREVRRDLFRALDMLSDEQLAFVPHEGLWPLGQVIRHIAQSEEFWFRYIVTKERAERPRFAPEQYATVAALKGLLTEVHQRTEDYLASLNWTDLERPYVTTWGETVTLFWIIWHVVEHEIHHRGEIYLMLGLQGMKGPDL